MGKVKYNVSEYGDDLEIDLIDIKPIITDFNLSNNSVQIKGQADLYDDDTTFCIEGAVFKTYDGNIVCETCDKNGNFDVLFLCLERNCQYNDYILHRGNIDVNDLKGAYGLKLYLMKKGTRDIYLLEDINVGVENSDNLLNTLPEIDYSSLNWFVNCFTPIQILVSDNEVSTLSELTTNTYTFTDTEVYAIGSDRIYLGFVLYATNIPPLIDFADNIFKWSELYPYSHFY